MSQVQVPAEAPAPAEGAVSAPQLSEKGREIARLEARIVMYDDLAVKARATVDDDKQSKEERDKASKKESQYMDASLAASKQLKTLQPAQVPPRKSIAGLYSTGACVLLVADHPWLTFHMYRGHEDLALYSSKLEKHLGVTDQLDQYGFYGVTLPSAWHAVKHGRYANWVFQYLEAVKAKDIEGRYLYSGLLRREEGAYLERQMVHELKRAKSSVFGFGALTVVSFIAERKGMLSRYFKRGSSGDPSKHG